MQKNILVLGINGSPHREGTGARLLAIVLDQCRKEGTQTELIQLVDVEKGFFDGEYTTEIPGHLTEVFRKILAADALVLSTPVHWFGPSALMVNFLSELTILELKGFLLEGKVGAVITTCEEDGGQKTAMDLVAALTHQGLLLPPYGTLFYNVHSASQSEHNWQNEDARLIGGNVVRLVKMLQPVNDWGYRSLV